MNKGFWDKLNKPIMALAPMADMTDSAMRQMFVKYGKPSLFMTEFVSARGLFSPGRDELRKDLIYDESERPLIVQFFGSDPEYFNKAAKYAQELSFDGIDINMGCPDKSVLKQKSGSSLIDYPELAKEIVLATKEGAGYLPVSIKTRTGFSTPVIETWIPTLLEAEPVAISIHGRTKSQCYGGQANWDLIRRAVELRNEAKSETLILGNGDVKSLEDAYQKVKDYGVDGVMVGRGTFGNPWFFNKDKPKDSITLKEKLEAVIEHAYLYEKVHGKTKKFYNMRKHFCSYVAGYPDTKPLKMELMKVESAKEAEKVIKKYL